MRGPAAGSIPRLGWMPIQERFWQGRTGPCGVGTICKGRGEVAERSKALDWNSSNIFTGVRGFESHPLRQFCQAWSGGHDGV